MLLGGEWQYIPGFSVPCAITYKIAPGLYTREVYEWLRDLINAFGEAWDVSVFYRVEKLKEHNREYSFHWFCVVC